MSTIDAIDAVKAQLSSDAEVVVLPENPQYDILLKSYFSGLQRDLRPACFLTPSTPSHVSAIVKALKPLAPPSSIAIAGAGQQSTTPGVANVKDGITVHLGKLKGIELDKGNGVVKVAAGERWGAVYEVLAAEGLAAVGNRHSSAGIGGDALQGGLSYFSYARGFTCDNVVNFEVVLSDGSIVEANAASHEDLWTALRGGGGNNLGIVTRFDMTVFEQGPMWGGKAIYAPDAVPSQIGSLVEYLEDPAADAEVHICVSVGYAAMMGMVLGMNDVFGSKGERPKALDAFADVRGQMQSTMRTAGLKELTDEGGPGAESNRVLKTSTTVKADAGLLEEVTKLFTASLEKLKEKNIDNLLFSLTFESIPVSLMKQSIARGNRLGFSPSEGALVVVLLYTSWNNPEDDAAVYSANRESLDAIDSAAKAKGLDARYRYMNYAAAHHDPMGSYGEDVKEEMKAASAKYDPDGFWQTAGVGPWKLST